jgi:hypothetical protein
MVAGISFLTGTDSPPANPDTLVARSLTGTLQQFSQSRPYIYKRRFRLNELNTIIPALR